MTNSIGSIWPRGTAGPASAAIDQADTVVDAAEAQPEHAAGMLAMMKSQPARAERQCVAQEPAEVTDENSEPNDDAPPPSGSPPPDMAALAPQMAGLFERAVHALTRRTVGDRAPLRRADWRRKRSC